MLIPASNRSSVIYFSIVNFLWWVGLYLYAPILPVYIQSTGARLNMVGGILSAYAIPQVLLRIPLGLWSDRLGRRKPLVAAGIIFSSLGALGLGLSSTSGLLFLSRIATGIGAAAWVVFPLYFSAYYPANESGKAFGLINFVQNIALIAATAGGGFIAEAFGLDRPFFVAASLGIFALLALAATRESPIGHPEVQAWRTSLSIAARPLLIAVSLVAILLNFAIFTGVLGFIPIYAKDIGASSSQLGLITMINLGFSALGTLAAVRVRQKLGYRTTIICGALLIGASLFAIPFIKSVPLLMAVQVSCGLGSGVLMTLFMILSVRGLPQQHQATAMGVYQAIYAVGMLVGPLVSGFLGGGSGLSTVFYLAASCVFLVAVAAFLPMFSRRSIG
jgi:MFS family permease